MLDDATENIPDFVTADIVVEDIKKHYYRKLRQTIAAQHPGTKSLFTPLHVIHKQSTPINPVACDAPCEYEGWLGMSDYSCRDCAASQCDNHHTMIHCPI